MVVGVHGQQECGSAYLAFVAIALGCSLATHTCLVRGDVCAQAKDDESFTWLQTKDDESLAARGGAVGIAAALGCSLATGVDLAVAEGGRSIAARRAVFGVNRFREVPVQPFWRLLIDNLTDPTLILLMCAAAVRALPDGFRTSLECARGRDACSSRP